MKSHTGASPEEGNGHWLHFQRARTVGFLCINCGNSISVSVTRITGGDVGNYGERKKEF